MIKTFKNQNEKIFSVSYSVIWVTDAAKIIPKALFAPNHSLTSINRVTLGRLLICNECGAHKNAYKKNPEA